MTPKPPRAARLFVRLASPGSSWTLTICRENVYFLFMGPSGSDTRRYKMHCKCHSTSICHSWGTFFTFRPLSSIIFMKIVVKAMPSWPHRCIKIIKIEWENEYILKTDQSDSKSLLIYLKWFQSDHKVCKMAPKWRQMTPKPARAAQPFVRLASPGPSWRLKICREMNIFCLWTRLGRTRSDMICITCAIRRLYATFGIPSFTFRPFSSVILKKTVTKVTSN